MAQQEEVTVSVDPQTVLLIQVRDALLLAQCRLHIAKPANNEPSAHCYTRINQMYEAVGEVVASVDELVSDSVCDQVIDDLKEREAVA